MAILLNSNQSNNNLSGENLLASSSLENSISEARNLSIELDQKIADLKSKTEEFKQESDVTLIQFFDMIDKKGEAFANSISETSTTAVDSIGKAVKDLEQGSTLIKDAWKTTSTIVAHIVLSVIGLALILYLALPTIKQAKDVLSSNQDVLKKSLETKKENEKLVKENKGLNDELISLNGFVNAIFKDKEKARREYQKWKSSYN
jgi:hypothetical protein